MTTVFICIDWFHPAYKAGGPVQSIANLVTQYNREQVNFKIFCSSADLDGSLNKGVAFDEWVYYNGHTQVWYASAGKRSLTAIKNEIKNTNAGILFVIGIYSWYFNILPLLLAKVPVKIISVRGMLHPGALSQKSFKKYLYLAFWKIAGLPRRYIFHATDVLEEAFIRKAFGNGTKVFIAGNFPRIFTLQHVSDKNTGRLRMVSIALISPMKNIALVLETLQHCRQQINYDIYGPIKDEAYWQQCLFKINMLPGNINVTYRGDVLPGNIEALLTGYEVFILPSKSENFGHALFEALSAGKPVITSHHTPFNYLDSNHAGRNVSLENTREIAETIDFFASMPALEFAGWNTGAHDYALKNLNVAQLKLQYDKMFFVPAHDLQNIQSVH